MEILNLSADVGVIGSADGPTAILVSQSDPGWIIPVLFVAALIVIAVSVRRERKKK